MTQAYPLAWPDGWPRTPWNRRQWSLPGGRSGKDWQSVVARLRNEVQRIGGANVVVSTNQPLRRDGLPYAPSKSRVDDPGAAVYFTKDDRPFVMAQDRYELLVDNVRSLALAIEGMRQMERHGGAHMMERAFSGFEALPAPGAAASWWVVLGVPRDAPIADCEAAYKRLAREKHPDAGGSSEDMTALNAAITEARKR